MNFYVASKFKNYRDVRHVIDELQANGYPTTFDWTRTSEFDALGNLLVQNPGDELTPKIKVDFALADLRGVLEADAVVLLYVPEMQGAYIEVGIALAHNKPVYIIGAPPFTIFWALPNVHFYNSLHTFFDHLHVNGA